MKISLFPCVIANPFPSHTHTHKSCNRITREQWNFPVDCIQMCVEGQKTQNLSGQSYVMGLSMKKVFSWYISDLSHTILELIIYKLHLLTLLSSHSSLFVSSSSRFLLLTLPHSGLTFLTSPFNRLCDKRSLSALCEQLCELHSCLCVPCMHSCAASRDVTLPFSPMEMCIYLLFSF